MALAFNLPHHRRFFYPIFTLGKIVERLSQENASHGIPRQNKWGVTVYEIPHDAIAGYILAFSIIPPAGKIHDPQYQLVLADPDDPSTQGYISFGQNTSLGRQLVNQLLSLTPSMLAGIITLTLRTPSRHPADGDSPGHETRGSVYLNLYQGRNVFYKCLVPRRFTRDEIPQPRQTPDGKWDFSAPNMFFHRHAMEFSDRLRVLIPKLSASRRSVSARPSMSFSPAPNHLAGNDSFIPEDIMEDITPY